MPVLISGGLQSAEAARYAFEQTGAAGVLLARGSLGNPWLFEQVLGRRVDEPDLDEILAELDWVIDCAVEHLGAERAARYLRKFYPWYVERLGGGKPLQAALQTRALARGSAGAAARRRAADRGVDQAAQGTSHRIQGHGPGLIAGVYTHPPTHTRSWQIPRLAGGFFLVRAAGAPPAVPSNTGLCHA